MQRKNTVIVSHLGVVPRKTSNSQNSANWRGSSLEEKRVWLTCPQLFAPIACAKRYENKWKIIRLKKTYVKHMKYQQNESCH